MCERISYIIKAPDVEGAEVSLQWPLIMRAQVVLASRVSEWKEHWRNFIAMLLRNSLILLLTTILYEFVKMDIDCIETLLI